MAKKAFHTPFLGRIGKIPAPRPPFRSIFLAKDAKSAKKPPKRPKLLGKLGALCERNSSAQMPDPAASPPRPRVGSPLCIRLSYFANAPPPFGASATHAPPSHSERPFGSPRTLQVVFMRRNYGKRFAHLFNIRHKDNLNPLTPRRTPTEPPATQPIRPVDSPAHSAYDRTHMEESPPA